MRTNRFSLFACFFNLLFLFFSTNIAYSQCNVSILNTTADTLTIPCGTSVQLERDTSGSVLIFDDFEGGQISSIWQTTSSASISNPCGPANSGSSYLWMGNTATAPRNLTTLPLDLSCGAEVCFQFRYAIQGGAQPCEGPDLAPEGVTFEYSVAGGGWTTIDYYTPNTSGSFNSQSPGSGDYTGWATYCYVLPPAASVSNVVLRWQQYASTAAGNDHWGIDAVSVESFCGSGANLWSTGDTGQFIMANNIQTPTQYWVRRIVLSSGATVPDTCFDSLIVQPTPLVVSFNIDNPLECYGQSQGAISASVTGGTNQQQFVWSNGGMGSTINNLTAGSYSVTVTDSAGCVVSDTFMLNEPDSLYALLNIQNTTCDTSSDGKIVAEASGGNFPYIFYWDGVAQVSGFEDSILQLDTGMYHLRIVDFNNCEFTDTIQISHDYPNPVIGLSDTSVFCVESSTVLDAGNAGAYFVWSTGDTSQTITVNIPGMYFVTVTSSEGCGSTDSTYAVSETCLGVTEIDSEQIDIYPNPLTDKLNIRLKTVGSGLSKVILYGKHGKLILDKSVNSGTETMLDMSHLAKGIYFLELQSETGQVYRKKVIKI